MPRPLGSKNGPGATGEAMKRLLDWCAQQEGTFTIKDMFDEYQRIGGGSTSIPGFTVLVKRVTSELGHEPSKEHPLVLVHQGSRGRGNPSQYAWGLDGPLRAPPPPSEFAVPDEDASLTNQNLHRLARLLPGGDTAAKDALKRWKTMNGDPDRIFKDIQRTVPKFLQMQAFHVAMSNAVQTQQISAGDAEAAEAEHDDEDEEYPEGEGWSKVSDEEEPEAPAPGTPFSPGARRDLPQATPNKKKSGPNWATMPGIRRPPSEATPPVSDDEEGGEAPEEDDDLDDAFASAPEVEPAGEPEGEAEPEEGGPYSDEEDSHPDEDEVQDEPGEHEQGEEKEYPPWLPDPDPDGDSFQSAMYDIVDELYPTVDEHSEIWVKLKDAKGEDDAKEIIRKSGLFPSPRMRARALDVVRGIFMMTGRELREGRLLSAYVIREETTDDEVPSPEKRGLVGVERTLPQYGMDETGGGLEEPVDFSVQSGLSRIMKVTGRR